MELPSKMNQTAKIDQFWHAINIIAFAVVFMFSVLFSIIGYLVVERLSSIDTQMTKMVEGQSTQDLKIKHLEDTKADKPGMNQGQGK